MANNNMLPQIPSFLPMENVTRKRKKPERDFIDELLGDEEPKTNYNEKRPKTHETSAELIKINSAGGNKENEHKPKQHSDIYRKTGGLVVQVGSWHFDKFL